MTTSTLADLDMTVPLGRQLIRAVPPLRRYATVDARTHDVRWQLRLYGQPHGTEFYGPWADYALDLARTTLRSRREARR